MHIFRIVLCLVYFLPFVCLYYGLYYLSLAMVLLAGVPYIKSKKLRAQYQELKEKDPDCRDLDSLRKAIRFWERLTVKGAFDSNL